MKAHFEEGPEWIEGQSDDSSREHPFDLDEQLGKFEKVSGLPTDKDVAGVIPIEAEQEILYEELAEWAEGFLARRFRGKNFSEAEAVEAFKRMNDVTPAEEGPDGRVARFRQGINVLLRNKRLGYSPEDGKYFINFD